MIRTADFLLSLHAFLRFRPPNVLRSCLYTLLSGFGDSWRLASSSHALGKLVSSLFKFLCSAVAGLQSWPEKGPRHAC